MPAMMCSVPLFLLALTSALAAPSIYPDDYTDVIPQKRAALVLDRLLVALQKALHEEKPPLYDRLDREGPRTAPLRLEEEYNDMVRLSALQRRGQTGNGRGRVLRCYFNAVTCF